MEELKNQDLDNAHQNEQINEMFEQEPEKNYAYPIYLAGSTYVGIKCQNKEKDYYVIKFDGIKPQEAIEHLHFKNLVTQYSENLTDKDRKELSDCHKEVAHYTLDIGIMKNITSGSRTKN